MPDQTIPTTEHDGGDTAQLEPNDDAARETAVTETSPPEDTRDQVSTNAGEPDDQWVQRQEEFRRRLADRIRGSARLPKGLRDRLAKAVDTVQLSADGDEEPTLRVSDAVAMIEEALPPHLSLDAEQLEPSDHPAGEGFFTGDARQLSDEEAARIARDQLASTGFGPAG